MKKLSIVLFGGNTKGQDSPLLIFAKIAREKNCDIKIITDKTHLNLPTKSGITFQEKLKIAKLEWNETNKLNLSSIEKKINKNSVGISLNSPWIFKNDIIDFFKGNLYNYHDSLLPKFRGAAGYTWAILQQERNWGLTIHRIEKSLDVGDIVKQKKIHFPKSCKIPIDYLNYKAKFERVFFSKFIEDLKNKKKFLVKRQDHSYSTYWPRLITPVNGFINWAWSSKQIELFIQAFDDPHQGVTTFLEGKKIRLKKCLKSNKKNNHHPFQTGIVFRKTKDGIFIATNDGEIIIQEVLNTNGKNISDKVKLGYRFYTPYKFLDNSLSNHANYQAIKKIESKNE
tara:strand:- start:7139 stop:8158 length:1020 start_codon:yes stop_codon:yes gene_type:complete